ncbi:MAG: hypothetical protein K0M63_07325 [Weeksellaceae bacterium]|nr:hypothetical protein [Weeksellaceae bacterium]
MVEENNSFQNETIGTVSTSLEVRHESAPWNFYTVVPTNSGIKVTIKNAAVLKYLEMQGIRKLKLPKGGYELVKILRNSILKRVDHEDLMHILKEKIVHIDHREDVWEEFLEGQYLVRSTDLAMERIMDVKLNIATKDQSFFFYSNGIISVKVDAVEIINYEDFEGFVFEDQIIKHNINIPEECPENMFNQFILNVSGGTEARYQQLCTAIGYLIQSYKDPSNTKAIILVDEVLDFAGEANGGTGKTLISKAVSKITPCLHKDGKSIVKTGNRFFYQDVNIGQRVMVIDDVNPNFNFEDFYSVVTGDLIVEQKGKQSYSIPFELSPKLLITSNYVVKGSGGSSDERRRVEIEIAPCYNMENTPIMEFGCRFFDDWDVDMWNVFFNQMFIYCQWYIRCGILTCPSINLKENKLKSETSIDFVEFADCNFVFSEEIDTIKKDKTELYEAFRAKYQYESRTLTPVTFKKWLDRYAKARGMEINHSKSNGKIYVEILKPKKILSISECTPVATEVTK